MSYFGLLGGRSKSAPTVLITVLGTGPSNATLSIDNGAPAVFTLAPGTWITLTSSLPNLVNFLEIFDSTGNINLIATGAPGSEVIQAIDYPGGNGYLPLLITAGTRIAFQVLSTPAVGSVISFNFYG